MTQPRIVFAHNTPAKNHRVSSMHTEMKGQPYLQVSSTGNFTWVYDDSGTGSDHNLVVYRPAPTDPTVFIIGDAAFPGTAAQGIAFTVKAINDDPANPLLMPPVGYTQIWNDQGSGGHNDGSIWQPVPPDGYVAIGAVATTGYAPPAIANYACLRRDQVEPTTYGVFIWSDQGSGGDNDVEIFGITGVSNAFVAQGNYGPPVGTCYKIKGQ